MYCLRCGREVPGGELFCAECSRQPIEREPAPVKEAPRSAEPVPRSAPKTEVAVAAPRSTAPKKKEKKLWIIPIVILVVMMIGESILLYKMYQDVNIQKANYRVKEANLASRENEIAEIEKNYTQALTDLELANMELAERDARIGEMEREILDRESAMSQNAYDVAAAERTIETLTEENTALSDENETLLTENETLLEEKVTLEEEKTTLETELEAQIAATAAVQAELDDMSSRYNYASTKATFMDNYVVFVNNNSTRYYHDYDCSSFAKSNFWAYSRKLAENNGYSACPNCGG